MSFYMVPTISYQAQQKLKNAKEKKNKHQKKKQLHQPASDSTPNSTSSPPTPAQGIIPHEPHPSPPLSSNLPAPSPPPSRPLDHHQLSPPDSAQSVYSYVPYSHSPAPSQQQHQTQHHHFTPHTGSTNLHHNTDNVSLHSVNSPSMTSVNTFRMSTTMPQSKHTPQHEPINEGPTSYNDDVQPTKDDGHTGIYTTPNAAAANNSSSSLSSNIAAKFTSSKQHYDESNQPGTSPSRIDITNTTPPVKSSTSASGFAVPPRNDPLSLDKTHSHDSAITPFEESHKARQSSLHSSHSAASASSNPFRRNSSLGSPLAAAPTTSKHPTASSSQSTITPTSSANPTTTPAPATTPSTTPSATTTTTPLPKQTPQSSSSRFTRRLSSPFLHDKSKHHHPHFSHSHSSSHSSNTSHHHGPTSRLQRKTTSPLHSPISPGTAGSTTNKAKAATTATASPTPSPGVSQHQHQERSSQQDQQSADAADSSSYFSYKVPQFKPILDLQGLNTSESLKATLFSPAFQIFRFNNFLEILADHQRSDPINFASIRHHSLIKFINRHRNTRLMKDKGADLMETEDIRSYEALLAYELISTRSFIRRLIYLESKESSKNTIINCEELVQINFTNYIRFILMLPKMDNTDHLDEISKNHYRIKKIFGAIQDGLHQLKREDSGDEVTNSTTSVGLLLQTITKVSYEYILLEKYYVHILTKLKNNSIFESRVTKRLFNLFHLHVTLKKPESIKVLNYNNHFSAQYSWYMSITIPFIRVFESNVYSEDEKLINDFDAYFNYSRNLPQSEMASFKESDAELFEHFFKHVNLRSDYDHYRNLPPKKLVELHKRLDDASPKYAHTKVAEPSATYSHKPMNFEYYTKSLATIETETFHAIQAADAVLQFTPTNYKIIVREFYRILKVGGVLEMPIIRLALADLNKLPCHPHEDDSGHHHNHTDFIDVNMLTKFDMIPNFTCEILKELAHVFGGKSLRYSIVLLNAATEVNSYLVKYIGLSINEIFGSADQFSSRFTQNEDESEDLKHNNISDGVHYYFYIKVEKT